MFNKIFKIIALCLLFAATGTLAFGLFVPVIAKRILSHNTYMQDIAEEFTKKFGGDFAISLGKADNFVIRHNFKLMIDKVELSNEAFVVTAEQIVVTLPFTQLITRRFKPSAVDIHNLVVNRKQGGYSILPIAGGLASLCDAGITSSVPNITLHGITLNYGRMTSFPGTVSIKRSLTGSSIAVVMRLGDGLGTIKLSSHKSKEKRGNILKAFFKDVELYDSAGHFVSSGAMQAHIDENYVMSGLHGQIDKLSGSLSAEEGIDISNTSFHFQFADTTLDINKFRSTVDGVRINGSASIVFDQEMQGVSGATISLDNGTLPLSLVRVFFSQVDIPLIGNIIRAKASIEQRKLVFADIGFEDVSITLNDMLISKLRGSIVLDKDEINANILSGVACDDVLIESAVVSRHNREEVRADVDIAVPAQRVVDNIKKLGLDEGDIAKIIIDGLSKENFTDELVHLKIGYGGKLVDGSKRTTRDIFEISWNGVAINNLDVNGSKMPPFFVDGRVHGGDFYIKCRPTDDASGDVSIKSSNGVFSIEIPVLTLYDIFPGLRKYLTKISSVTGIVAIDTHKQGNHRSVVVDLSKASVNIPIVKFTSNNEGVVSFTMRDSVLYDVLLRSAQKSIRAEMISIANNGVKLSHLFSNKNNDVSVDMRSDGNAVTLYITGDALELGAVNYKAGSNAWLDTSEDFRILMNLDKLYLSKGIVIEKFKLAGRQVLKQDLVLEMGGFFDQGEIFYFSQDQKGKSRMLARNAGKLLTGLDITSAVTGGAMRLNSEKGTSPMESKVDITGFKVTKTPIMARLLSFASLTGLLNTLNGSGIYFDTMHIEYTKKEDHVDIGESFAKGEAIGVKLRGSIHKGMIDVSGVLSTINVIDRAIQVIPFYGDILTGGVAGGVLGVNFSIKGDVKDPVIFVNPLSILTPGIMKKLFEKKHAPPFPELSTAGL